MRAVEKLGIEWHTSDDGFVWRSKDMDETVARARHGWELAQAKIASSMRVLRNKAHPLYMAVE